MVRRLADPVFRVAIEAGDLLRPHRAGVARYAECLLAALLARKDSAEVEVWARPRRAFYWFRKPRRAKLRFFWGHPPRHRPDVFHATSCVFPPWRSGVEIATVHDLYAIREELRLPADELRRRSHYVRRADIVICLSHHTRNHLHALLDLPKSHTLAIRPAAHPMFVPASSEEKLLLQRKYALAKEFFLFLGRDRANKNLDRLVEAYASTGLKMPLYFAGQHSRSTQHRLRRLARARRSAGSLRWLGRFYDAELSVLLSCASTLCLPSTFEGFGLPIVEAMACGTAVMTSAGRATEEAGGGMAVLVDPESTDSIADGLVRSLVRSEAQLCAAHRYATSRTWNDVAEETWRVYECAFPASLALTGPAAVV